MKKTFAGLYPWVLIGLFLLSQGAFADHEIMPWKDNRAAAVSVTFDDGLVTQFTRAVPLLNARNLKGTFFVITSNTPDQGMYWAVGWDQWRQVAEQGHEIGSHSVDHLLPTILSEAELRWELGESQRVINQNIPFQTCVSLAYPYAECNDFVRAVTSEYYIAARTSWSSEGGHLNYYTDRSSWKAINFYSVGSQSIPESQPRISDLDLNLSQAIQENAWLSIHFHDILDTNFFAAVLDDLLSKDVWVSTFGTIARYMRERMSSTLTVLSEDSTKITLNLTHSLDTPTYNQPLTIRSAVPPNWHLVDVRQGDVSFTVNSAVEGPDTVIYYDAVPNFGTISLTLWEGEPTLTTISVSPSSASIAAGATRQFTAVAKDQLGNALVPQPSFGWTVGGEERSRAAGCSRRAARQVGRSR